MNLAAIESRWASLLSADQIEFCQAFLVTQSTKSAAEMVGLTPAQGQRYIKSPTIQAAIKMGQKQLREGCDVTPEEVLSDLRLMRDMALGRIPVPETKWVDGEPVTRYVKQYNANAANKAVENLGRVVGMFTDRKEISMVQTDEQLKSRLEDLLGVSLDITDAEYAPVGDIQAQLDDLTDTQATLPPKETPPSSPSEEPRAASELTAAFESFEEDELTLLLAQACDEHKV
jgi:phage terminase small subunit